MKEIVVISGKGGTGKTSITAAFAVLCGNDGVVGDCDVDAADLHMLLDSSFSNEEEFYSGKFAEIDLETCTGCGVCFDICRFDAIKQTAMGFVVNQLDCEGCSYCSRLCPEKSITMKDSLAGKFYISDTRINQQMVHARLGIGAENSGKLVAKVKKEANILAKQTGKEYVIIDGSPGIGCPVISSLSGANLVVLVTEPTVSGLHDLKRVFELVKKFSLGAACIINKYDINEPITCEIEEFLAEEKIEHLCNLPYDDNFSKAMIDGKTIVEYDNGLLKSRIEASWFRIKELIN
jgi:MinD superfamily P-loop ATPase